MEWKIEQIPKKLPKINNPILIEGLPGIGNVGKIAADLLVDDLNAKLIYRFFSYSMPNTVFINEKNLVELPKIEIYYYKGKRDILFLVGDIQPMEEVSSYLFSELIINILLKHKGNEIITLGGIGLPSEPEEVNVYCTGNNLEYINNFKKGLNINSDLYGIVGSIMGISGLLLGLSSKKNINAIALLSETMAHPVFLGIKGAKEILRILNKKYGFKIDLSSLDKEIKEIEQNIKKLSELQNKQKKGQDVNYIG
jgi:uncharacterized protein